MVRITMDGVNEVINFLSEISSPKKADQVLNIVISKTLLLAFKYAPEDTGKMESNITWQKTGDEYELVCDIPYAIYNEYGTYRMPAGTEDNPLNITSTSGKSAYRPFLRPAAYQVLNELDTIINSVFFGSVISKGDE